MGTQGTESSNLDVLMIGNNSEAHSPLSRWLRRRACNCLIAVSIKEVFRLIDLRCFDLVLGPIRLNGESLFPLIGRLSGSVTTMFYSLPIEDSSLWIPARRLGRYCFGEPPLRAREFTCALDKALEEIRSVVSAANATREAIASHSSNPANVFSLPRRAGRPAAPNNTAILSRAAS